jgi:hypothetical protein
VFFIECFIVSVFLFLIELGSTGITAVVVAEGISGGSGSHYEQGAVQRLHSFDSCVSVEPFTLSSGKKIHEGSCWTNSCSGSAENGECVSLSRVREGTHEESTEALRAGEEVAAEGQIVDFVRCWPEETEIGVRGSSSGAEAARKQYQTRRLQLG